MRKFSLDMVFVQPHPQPSQPQHERKKSVSYSIKSQHHHPFLHNVLVARCMWFHTTCTLCFTFCVPQCMEEASSKKVLTSNVTAAITKHKVSVVATDRYETNMGIEAPK